VGDESSGGGGEADSTNLGVARPVGNAGGSFGGGSSYGGSGAPPSSAPSGAPGGANPGPAGNAGATIAGGNNAAPAPQTGGGGKPKKTAALLELAQRMRKIRDTSQYLHSNIAQEIDAHHETGTAGIRAAH
jgi:hypothetical protein